MKTIFYSVPDHGTDRYSIEVPDTYCLERTFEQKEIAEQMADRSAIRHGLRCGAAAAQRKLYTICRVIYHLPQWRHRDGRQCIEW